MSDNTTNIAGIISAITGSNGKIYAVADEALKLSAEDLYENGKALSTAIGKKVTIDNRICSVTEQTDLSIVKLSSNEYYDLVETDTAVSNVVYIVEDGFANAMGRQVKNVAPGTDLSDAVTVEQLQSEIDDIVIPTDLSDFSNSPHYVLSSQLTSIQISYDQNAKKIVLQAGGSTTSVDCTDFIKDGMLSTAELCAGQLIFNFNTDAGSDPISIVLSDFIDQTQYWKKSETSSTIELDAKFETKADLSALNKVADSLSDYYTKTETSSAVEILNALDGKQPTGDYALTSQLPTKMSELSNDSGFITSAQVEPFDNILLSGYAKNSFNAVLLNAFGANGLPSDNDCAQASANYNAAANSWNFDIKCVCRVFAHFLLSKFFEETFSPNIQLTWCYQTIWRYRAGRWSKAYTGWMWNAAGQYAITASEDGTPDGKFYVLYSADETHQNCINDPATDTHTVEFGLEGYCIVITTIDGQADQITCYRYDRMEDGYVRYVAFEDELSAKADVSVLNEVSNSLSDYYQRSETSSAAEISDAFSAKADLSLVEQLSNALSSKTYDLSVDGELVRMVVDVVSAFGGTVLNRDYVLFSSL